MLKTKEIAVAKESHITFKGLKYKVGCGGWEEYCNDTCMNFCENIGGYDLYSANTFMQGALGSSASQS